MFDRGTLKLATIAGIPVRLHWSFVFIFAWVGYNAWIEGLPLSGFLFLQSYVLILFFCVVLHEFGHALTARRFGNKTRDILLTPIGGIARLESISEKPMQELLIAVAGPAVNLVIAGVIAIILFSMGSLNAETFSSTSNLSSSNLLPLIMLSNIILAVFNFIPAFPMDGGRVLRALLSLKWPRVKATLIAARLGQLCAILFLYYAISQGQWMLSLVSVFIFFTAGSELKQIRWEAILQAHTVNDIINTAYNKVSLHQPLAPLVDELQKGIEKNYIVVNEYDMPIGNVSYQRLLYAAKNKWHDKTVSDIINRNQINCTEDQNLKEVFHLMQLHGSPIATILKDDVLIGAIEDDQVKRFVEIKLNKEL